MIIFRFSNGGFVLHGINGLRLSAWYDSDGKLLDTEQYNRRNIPQKTSAENLKRCVDLGQYYKYA